MLESFKILSTLTFSIYLLLAFYQLGHWYRRWPVHRQLSAAGNLAPLIGHGWLLHHWVETGIGQNLSLPVTVSCMLWLMGLIHASLIWRFPRQSFVLLLYPLSALSILCVELYPVPHVVETAASSLLFLHIIFSLLALSVLGLAALQACLYGIQHRRLQKGHAIFQVFPPLEAMELMLFRLIWLGLIILSLGLFIGFHAFDQDYSDGLWPKLALSVLSWCLFIILLVGHYRAGWRGMRAVKATLIGVAGLWLAYILSTIY